MLAYQRGSLLSEVLDMMQVVSRQAAAHWAAWFGLACGAFLMPTLLDVWKDYRLEREVIYQRSLPVVTMTGSIVGRGNGYVLIHMAGTKHRDCKYLGLVAYSASREGVNFDANIRRDDLAEKADTKAPGVYDIGIWRVWPVHDVAASVVVKVRHECNGVEVATVIANVGL